MAEPSERAMTERRVPRPPEQVIADLERELAVARDPATRATTHSEDCWRWRGHHACAIARVGELERELAAWRAKMPLLDELSSLLGVCEGVCPLSTAVHAIKRSRAENAALRERVAALEAKREAQLSGKDF